MLRGLGHEQSQMWAGLQMCALNSAYLGLQLGGLLGSGECGQADFQGDWDQSGQCWARQLLFLREG